MARDYKREYETYHSKSKAKKKRAAANRARKDLGLKKGDKRDASHMSDGSVKKEARGPNRSRGGKVGNRAGKARGGRKSKPGTRKS